MNNFIRILITSMKNFGFLTLMSGAMGVSLGHTTEENKILATCEADCIQNISSSSWCFSPTITAHDKELILSVPYVLGDVTGELTTQVIHELQSLPQLRIDDNASIILEISILDESEEKLGYRRDPTKTNKKIIPSENRSQMLVKVSLNERGTNKTLYGPSYILGAIDYDHQNNSIDNNILAYSMGQLADIDTAQDVTHIPLYRDIARKVAAWLQTSREVCLTIFLDK